MTGAQQNPFPVVALNYREGDLIIKEGDYGISIYKIKRGKVLIFKESGDKEVALSTLEPGAIFGEIAFLSKAGETRSASARALEDSELEVWHPSMLAEEYQDMSPMLRYVINHVLTRLLRMSRLLVQLSDNERNRRKAMGKSDPYASRRNYYRKNINLECHYWPVRLSPKVGLTGRIRDVSLTGVGLEIAAGNTAYFSHMEGERFVINTVLPNGKRLELEAKIVTSTISETHKSLFLGMSITELSADAKKSLGFLLMP